MTKTATENQLVEISIPTPILDVIDKSLSRILKKNLSEIATDTNTAIERGVKTDETAREAETIVQDGRKAIKITNEVRLQFTRPIEEGKKSLMREVEKLLAPVVDSCAILDRMVLARASEIRRKEAEAQRELEEKQRVADEKARAKEERNRNISLGKGGDGNVAPVVPETIAAPVSTAGMRSTTRLRSIPDLPKIEEAIADGIREIPGVKIFQIWQFTVDDAKMVPKEYRRDTRG